MGPTVDFTGLAASCVRALCLVTVHGVPAKTGGVVTDRIYLVIAGMIGFAIVADIFLYNSVVSLFLIGKLFHLVDYLEFWR